MRRPQQRAGLGGGDAAVGPAVQGADDVAGGRPRLGGVHRTAPLQHQGLAMATDVRDQLDAAGRSQQGAAVSLMRQCGVVTYGRHAQRMADIARPVPEQEILLALVQRSIEVA